MHSWGEEDSFCLLSSYGSPFTFFCLENETFDDLMGATDPIPNPFLEPG
jgi:hypothetical protein